MNTDLPQHHLTNFIKEGFECDLHIDKLPHVKHLSFELELFNIKFDLEASLSPSTRLTFCDFINNRGVVLQNDSFQISKLNKLGNYH